MSFAGSLAGSHAGSLANSLAGGGIATPLDVLGAANLAIEYDPARGFTLNGSDIDSLACQRSGHVISALAAGNRPAYTASDPDFGGFPSFTSSEPGADCLRSAASHGSDLIASGASPYVAWLGKLIDATPPATHILLRMGSVASESIPFGGYRVTAAGGLEQSINAVNSPLISPTEAVHLFELFYDGSGNVEFWQDNAFVEENATAAYASEVRRVALGGQINGGGTVSAKHAYYIAALSVNAAQRAALLPFWRARGAPV